MNNLIPIQIVNIYGCNEDNPDWFSRLFNIIDRQLTEYLIITGDWNTTLSEKDTYNYQHQRNLKSREAINSYIKKNNYIDIWREQNNDQRRFTWGTKKPFKRSRLDYFIISEDILTFTPKAEIKMSYRSDHNTISLKLNINTNPRGKGSWKLNNNLLTNIDYITLVKETINLAKYTYALPIYSPEFINKDNGENLEITINNDLFLNTLLCQIRGETIKFSKKIARERNQQEIDLNKLVISLETEIDKNKVINNDKITELEECKIRLEQIREEKLKGNQVRSRYQHTKDWEKPSKYFLNLEKRNFLNKNINELKDENNNVINNPQTILNMQQKFYSDLFKTKCTNRDQHTRYDHFLKNIPKLSDNTKTNINRPLTLKELEIAIKSSKNNKAPGPDGYSNEFFKMFNQELKHWIFRVYQEAINRDYLNDLILEGTITCIPKAGKSRDSLKNWRPLTLLNSIYKFYSTIISNRIKSTLENLINPDQTGFISNRFLGENTRLLLDTMNYCEQNSVGGLLVVVDYAKAFDTIEWSFIEFCLELFNYGTFIKNAVKLLQKNSFSKIEQNGHFSARIQLSRGCRQGDPISPYLFVICAEVLSHVIRENKDIKGIMIGDIESKLSQYADDTTLFLKDDKDTLRCVIDVLRWFDKISGLAINRDKTKVIKIGAARDRRISWEGQFGLNWTHTFEVLGIEYDVFKLSEITELNLNSKIVKIKKLIRTWSTRKLTPYGKVTIVKSLLLSKITHILLSLPSPNPETFKTLENIFLSFIWNDKPAKFSKTILEAEVNDGGLKMHNLFLFDKALKLGWLKRFLSSNGKWKIFLDMEDFHEIFNYGNDYTERMYEIIQIPFWRDVLSSLKLLFKSNVCTEINNVCNIPLWYNSTLRLPLKHKWFIKGVSIVGDILTEDCKIMNLEQFQQTYKIKTNFLEYGGFALTVKLFIDNLELPNFNLTRPSNSLLNKIINKDSSGVSNIYKSLHPKNSHIAQNICTKWYDKADIPILPYDVKRSFSVTNNQVEDTYLRFTQFRTLHYRFYTNDVLTKCKIMNDDTCSICCADKDSNYHMLLDCIHIRHLWSEVENWIKEISNNDYILTDRRKILGDLENNATINIIILNTKKVIYLSKLDNKKPRLLQVQLNVKKVYNHDLYKLLINNKQIIFERKWSLLLNFFRYNH